MGVIGFFFKLATYPAWYVMEPIIIVMIRPSPDDNLFEEVVMISELASQHFASKNAAPAYVHASDLITRRGKFLVAVLSGYVESKACVALQEKWGVRTGTEEVMKVLGSKVRRHVERAKDKVDHWSGVKACPKSLKRRVMRSYLLSTINSVTLPLRPLGRMWTTAFTSIAGVADAGYSFLDPVVSGMSVGVCGSYIVIAALSVYTLQDDFQRFDEKNVITETGSSSVYDFSLPAEEDSSITIQFSPASSYIDEDTLSLPASKAFPDGGKTAEEMTKPRAITSVDIEKEIQGEEAVVAMVAMVAVPEDNDAGKMAMVEEEADELGEADMSFTDMDELDFFVRHSIDEVSDEEPVYVQNTEDGAREEALVDTQVDNAEEQVELQEAESEDAVTTEEKDDFGELISQFFDGPTIESIWDCSVELPRGVGCAVEEEGVAGDPQPGMVLHLGLSAEITESSCLSDSKSDTDLFSMLLNERTPFDLSRTTLQASSTCPNVAQMCSSGYENTLNISIEQSPINKLDCWPTIFEQPLDVIGEDLAIIGRQMSIAEESIKSLGFVSDLPLSMHFPGSLHLSQKAHPDSSTFESKFPISIQVPRPCVDVAGEKVCRQTALFESDLYLSIHAPHSAQSQEMVMHASQHREPQELTEVREPHTINVNHFASELHLSIHAPPRHRVMDIVASPLRATMSAGELYLSIHSPDRPNRDIANIVPSVSLLDALDKIAADFVLPSTTPSKINDTSDGEKPASTFVPRSQLSPRQLEKQRETVLTPITPPFIPRVQGSSMAAFVPKSHPRLTPSAPAFIPSRCPSLFLQSQENQASSSSSKLSSFWVPTAKPAEVTVAKPKSKRRKRKNQGQKRAQLFAEALLAMDSD